MQEQLGSPGRLGVLSWKSVLKSGERVEDLVDSFGPAEGFGMTVAVFEVSADGVLQFAGAAVNPAVQLPFGEQRKPALDQVEPGAAGGSEVQMKRRWRKSQRLMAGVLWVP